MSKYVEHALPANRRRRLLGCALAALGTLAAPFGLANPVPANVNLERSVKAAFLYKFLGYTEYPAASFGDATTPFIVGVVGDDDMAAELSRTVSGRYVNNRAIVVKALRESDAPGALHLLFIPGDDSARIARLLKAARQGAVLVVTECENGLQHGSVINFKIVEQRVRFDVSLEAADRNNVKLSSRLLTVANQVHKGPL